MKRFTSLFILLFVLFIPKVYAFTYDIDTGFSNKEVTKGKVVEIKVGLKNIQGTSYGIGACTLNIEFDNNILLDSKIRSLGSWTMTIGKMYLFDRGNLIIDDNELFVIPVKINGNGKIRIFNIECSDGETLSSIGDKIVNFTVIKSNLSGNNGTVNQKSSNCDLSDIKLSEGAIEFDSDVTEYYLEVDNYDNLIVDPILSDNKATFLIERTNGNTVTINVVAEDGTNKVYTLFIRDSISSDVDTANEKNNIYVPIFIAIICVLVLINVIRIVVKLKK